MKHRSLLLIITLTLILCSCNQQKTKQKSNNTITEKTEIANYLTVEDLLEQAEYLTDTSIYLSGIIDHVCRHGGRRFKILSTDGLQELKIELDEKLKVPDPSVAGNLAKIKGTVVSVKMTAEMVKAWEEKERINHKGEENTEHFKLEIAEIQSIYKQITAGEIPFYTMYTVQAEKYELE